MWRLVCLLALCACTSSVRYPRTPWLYDRAAWQAAREDGRCDESTGCCAMPMRAGHTFTARHYMLCCPDGQGDVRCAR